MSKLGKCQFGMSDARRKCKNPATHKVGRTQLCSVHYKYMKKMRLI